MADLLLLDYNGVIVDDEPLHCAALRDVLADDGIALDEATYYADYLGLDDRGCLRTAFRRAGRALDGARLERLARRKADAYAALARAGLPLVPGVAGFVRAAAAELHARVGVVSGALRHEIAAGLESAGIAALVGAVLSAEDVSAAKPDPAGYALAVARLAGGGPAHVRAVAVEDSLPGLAAARAAGAGCVMLTTSHAAPRLAGADAIWDSFAGHAPAELAPLLHTLESHGRA